LLVCYSSIFIRNKRAVCKIFRSVISLHFVCASSIRWSVLPSENTWVNLQLSHASVMATDEATDQSGKFGALLHKTKCIKILVILKCFCLYTVATYIYWGYNHPTQIHWILLILVPSLNDFNYYFVHSFLTFIIIIIYAFSRKKKSILYLNHCIHIRSYFKT